MLDWKVIAGGVIILIVIISAVMFGMQGTGFTGFAILEQQGPTKNITVSASLISQNAEFSSPIETVTIEAEAQDKEIFIGNQKIDLSSPRIIELTDYSGKMTINGEQISIGGSSKTVSVNGVLISPQEGDVSIAVDDMIFKLVALKEIILSPTTYENANGYIYVKDDKFYIKLIEEDLKMGAFRGDIEISGAQMQIDGVTDLVSLEGKTGLVIDE